MLKIYDVKKSIILFMFSPLFSFSQRVYVVSNRSEADLIVYKTKYVSEAHLVVSKTDNPAVADTTMFFWYLVDSKKSADPGWIIYYTNKKQEADTCVFFSNKVGLLGRYTPKSTELKKISR